MAASPVETDHPEHLQTIPGRAGQHADHDKHAGHSVAMFRDKFWLTLALTIPILVWGHMLPHALGYAPLAVPGAHLIPPVLGTAVYVYGGWPFVRGPGRSSARDCPA